MNRPFLLLLWVCSLLLFVSCNLQIEADYADSSSASNLAEMNENIREALQENNFSKVDSLGAVVISKATEANDQLAIIEAKTHLVSSYLDRNKLIEGEALLQSNLERIKEYGSPRHEMRAYIQLSNLRFADSRDDEGMDMLDKAMELESRVDNASSLGALYASRARAISNRAPVDALQLYYTSLEKFEASGEIDNKAVAHNNIGLISHNQGNYETALEHYNKALALNREIGNQLQIAANYNNIANSLSKMDKKEAAADTLFRAVMINQKMGISPRLIQNYYNLAQIYLETDQFDLAYSFFSQAYEESHSINFVPGIMYHAVGLANTLYKKERFDEVQEYLFESRTLAERLDNLDVLARNWDIQSKMNEAQGDYREALAAVRERQNYEDQIDSIRRDREFEEVRAGLELELRTAENELLRQELTYRERLGRNQQLGLISLVIGVLVTVILLLFLFRNMSKLEKVNRSLKQKNQVITAKNNQLRHLNSELKHLNDEKSRFVGMIIHDLRNPLFAVIGFLELIGESLTDETEKEHLQMAMNSANRLNQLINSLLEVHTIEKETKNLKLKKVPVDEIVKHAVTNFQEIARKKDIQIQDRIEMLVAESDSAYLSRIVDNLVSNAVKYSPRHSSVRVEVNKVDGSAWELAVEDEGPGISDEDKENLYQMFGRLTAKPTGGEESTGLGLYTVKLLVGRLGGAISLESEIGKGSRFICRFPLLSELDPDYTETQDEHQGDGKANYEMEDAVKL